MGGRGASSRGASRAPNGYRTVGRAGGIKVIRSSRPDATTGLPIKAQSGARYLGTDRKGRINQLRIYDKHGNVQKDIDWGHGFKEDGKSYPPGTVHTHEWGNGVRGEKHRLLTSGEIKKFRPSIEKATKGETIKWQ